MKFNAETDKIIQESLQKEELLGVIAQIESLLHEHQLEPTDTQWMVMMNHVNEMLNRKHANEKIQGVDISLFEEVSDTALTISQKVTEKIGGLPIEESYLLSIHFETIKQNNL